VQQQNKQAWRCILTFAIVALADTPGLLNRPEADRNAMERLTLACLQHLPTCVLFVADLTGECGTSVASQWRIRWGWATLSGWHTYTTKLLRLLFSQAVAVLQAGAQGAVPRQALAGRAVQGGPAGGGA
jgi:hypothetical protein